jgi:hypothetical protein
MNNLALRFSSRPARNSRNWATTSGRSGRFAPLDTYDAGDDVQDHAIFEEWQTAIETLLTDYIVSHAAGSKFAEDYYVGAAAIPTYADLAALMSAAGLSWSNWRRYTTHPDDGGSVQYGKCQAGDIIGPWLWEDLQACINCMVWRNETACSWTGYAKEADVPFVPYTHMTWASVTDEAESAYAAADETDTTNAPWQMSHGENHMPRGYSGGLHAGRARAVVSGLLTTAAKTVEPYVLCGHAGIVVFDDNGTTGVSDTNYYRMEQLSASAGDAGKTTSACFGSTTQPVWCDEPRSSSSKGWIVASVICIAKYDFDYQ